MKTVKLIFQKLSPMERLPRQKKDEKVGPTRCGKGTKIMIQVDRHGTPVAIETASARQSEVRLIEPLLEKMTMQNRQTSRLIYGKAADSDGLHSRS